MPGTTSDNGSLTGVIERILFCNEENGYCVAELRLADAGRTITVSGPLPGVQCGETLKLSGEWTRHPKHGDQFKVAAFKSELPATVHGIRKYLGSGMIRGIGKTYAAKIVDHFGADTLKVIGEESGRLHEVPGIGRQRAKAIKQAWDEQRAVRDVMMFLQTYGVTTSQCVRLVAKYGTGASRILRDEPYRLAEDIERIGFRTADKIALNLGFSTNSKERVDAGILHTLHTLEDDGHTLATEDALSEQSLRLLGVEPGLVRNRIAALVEAGRLLPVQARDEAGATLGPACQLPPTASAERRLAEAVARIGAAPAGRAPIKTEAAVDWAEKRAGFTFAGQQKAAVRAALEAKVAVITGGPGTGKTTIVRAVVDILRAKRARVLLGSPTGRAAQRLAEAAGAPASTIHRLLKYDPATRGFLHREDNPLPCDMLILDEASMLDTRLAAQVFQAVPSAAQLLLVGDADQLPAVGPGNVLADLMAAPPAAVTRLDTIYRQGADSGIVATAHRILHGEAHPGHSVRSFRDLDPEQDVHFIECDSAAQCLEAACYLARDYLPRTYGTDPVTDLQVLSPMHRGTAGITTLNTELQETLNPAAAAAARLRQDPAYHPGRQGHFRQRTGKSLPADLEYGNQTFRLGDKVLQTRNNYDKGVFNGDTGTVSAIAPDRSGLSVRFDNETVEFARGELSDLVLAYAISIHKSQGSEYPVVVVPLLKEHFLLLQRNLLYTAITRARRKVFLLGSLEAYAMAVRNHESRVRRTHLQTRLRTAAAKAGD